MKRAAGWTLIELTLGCTLLTLVVLGTLALCEYGFRSFTMASVRSGARSEMQRLTAWLSADLESTLLGGVSTTENRAVVCHLTGQPPASQARSIGCFPTLRDWNNAAAYDPNDGKPKWDSYLIYHADLAEVGSVTRLQLDAPAGASGSGWDKFAGYVSDANGSLWGAPALSPPTGGTARGLRVISSRRLTGNLLSFALSRQSNGVEARISLRWVAPNLGQGARNRQELLSVVQLLVCRQKD